MRITQYLLAKHADNASTFSENFEYRANRRNGYVALDVYIKGGPLVNTLFIGTSREVYNYLDGIIDGARYKTMMKPF